MSFLYTICEDQVIKCLISQALSTGFKEAYARTTFYEGAPVPSFSKRSDIHVICTTNVKVPGSSTPYITAQGNYIDGLYDFIIFGS